MVLGKESKSTHPRGVKHGSECDLAQPSNVRPKGELKSAHLGERRSGLPHAMPRSDRPSAQEEEEDDGSRRTKKPNKTRLIGVPIPERTTTTRLSSGTLYHDEGGVLRIEDTTDNLGEFPVRPPGFGPMMPKPYREMRIKEEEVTSEEPDGGN